MERIGNPGLIKQNLRKQDPIQTRDSNNKQKTFTSFIDYLKIEFSQNKLKINQYFTEVASLERPDPSSGRSIMGDFISRKIILDTKTRQR